MATASGVYGSQSYSYDGVGNRTARTIPAATETYTYASTANQIGTITDAVAPATGSGTYLFNGFHQRVQKIAGGVTTQFVFDSAGNLLEEADGSGATQKQYIWLDDVPVAMVDATGMSPVLYFIHTDQIGTPQKLTNGTLSIVWDGVFDPFGNPASGASLSLTNLRFPGQYFDGESQLNQNWMRDYSSTTARYIQSDKIGVLAGTNTYAYVSSNPVNSSDPFGLWQITISGGGNAGGILSFGYNSGQWNIGIWAGAGAGLAWDINPFDSGCEDPGVTTSWRMMTNFNLGKQFGGQADLTLAKSGANLGLSGGIGGGLNFGVNLKGAINGPTKISYGPTVGGSKNPYKGGASAAIGYGFSYYSGR